MGGFNHFFRTTTAINRNHHQTSGYVHDYSELSYIQTQSHYGNHEVLMNPDSGSHPLVPNEVGVSKFHSVFPASVPPPLPETRNGWGFFFLVGTLPQMHMVGVYTWISCPPPSLQVRVRGPYSCCVASTFSFSSPSPLSLSTSCHRLCPLGFSTQHR